MNTLESEAISRLKQESGINPAFFDEGTKLGACYCPDKWYRAVAVAGDLLRKSLPDTYLARHPLREDIFGHEPNLPQTVLRNIINSSLDEEPATESRLELHGNYLPPIEACANAEEYFSFTLQVMDIGAKLPSTHCWRRSSGWAIVTNNDGQPAGFIKAGRVQSFMSTEPIAIDRISFPAGSLFGVSLKSVHLPKPGERLYVKTDHVRALRFRRLTAFALPPGNRRDVFTEVNFNDPVENWPMSHIRQTVKKALGCSVLRV